jgi:hypothetical protein
MHYKKQLFPLFRVKAANSRNPEKNSPEIPKSGKAQFGGVSQHPQRPFAYFFVCRQTSLFIGYRLATQPYPLHSMGPADTMVSVSYQTFF